MKTSFASALLICCLACESPSSQNEIDAIKEVIQRETDTFMKVDLEGWQNSWLHEPYAYWTYSDSTGTSFIEGWDGINQSFDTYFKTQVPSRNIDVAGQSAGLTIERTWREFRVYGTGAYVQYTQKVKDTEIARDETSQIRVLEKKDGKWYVVYVGIVAKYPDESL